MVTQWLSWWSSSYWWNASEEGSRTKYLAVYGGLGGVQTISIMTKTIIIFFATLKGSNHLHKKMLIRILMSPISFFDKTPVGRILNRFAKDVDSMDNSLPPIIRFCINQYFLFIGTLLLIISVFPEFGIFMIPVGIVFSIYGVLFVRTSRQLQRLQSISRSPIYSHFGETITGATTIRTYGKVNEFIVQSEEKVDDHLKCCYPKNMIDQWLEVRLQLIGNLITFVAVIFVIIYHESVNEGQVGMVITNALGLTQWLSYVVTDTAELQTNMVAVERVVEYCELEGEKPWIEPELRPSKDWPQKGGLEFLNYGFKYRQGQDLVLKDLSFVVKGGENIGIVGRTGAGKSSLTLALFRICEAAQGKIIIDGMDTSKFGLHDLRNNLTIIPQDPVLFSGTLRFNLDPFNNHKDDKIHNALEHSHLKHFVSGLPGGLNHEICERGENLSLGQRQLVCLARALLRKSKVLILDEATASVDLDTDDLIQATIRTEFADSTILTIAHRLNTIMDYDKIMVLDKGRMIEFDTPDNLLNDEDSLFFAMAKNAGVVCKESYDTKM